jgi:hypothetical protein
VPFAPLDGGVYRHLGRLVGHNVHGQWRKSSSAFEEMIRKMIDADLVRIAVNLIDNDGLQRKTFDMPEQGSSGRPESADEKLAAMFEILERADAWTRAHVAQLNETIAQLRKSNEDQHQAITRLDSEVASLRQAVAQRDSEVASLRQAVAQRDSEVASLRQAVAQRDSEIAALANAMSQREVEIAQLRTSTSWRLTRPLRILSQRIKHSA